MTPGSFTTEFTLGFDLFSTPLPNQHFLIEMNNLSNSPDSNPSPAETSTLNFIQNTFFRKYDLDPEINPLVHGVVKQTGEMCIFQTSIVHCGPFNHLNATRECFFLVLTSNNHFSDQYQEFEWLIVELIYGSWSPEHEKSLIKWKHKNPQYHETVWEKQIQMLLILYPEQSLKKYVEQMRILRRDTPWGKEKNLEKQINKQLREWAANAI
jgi:hypothetical protein